MQAHVRLFAALAEALGRREMTVDLPDGATVADLSRKLGDEFPHIAQYRANLAYAVNAVYVSLNHTLKDGDEVALIPPVSGGSYAV